MQRIRKERNTWNLVSILHLLLGVGIKESKNILIQTCNDMWYLENAAMWSSINTFTSYYTLAQGTKVRTLPSKPSFRLDPIGVLEHNQVYRCGNLATGNHPDAWTTTAENASIFYGIIFLDFIDRQLAAEILALSRVRW